MRRIKGSLECFKSLYIHSLINNKDPKAVNDWLDNHPECCDEFTYERISLILGITMHEVVETEKRALNKIKEIIENEINKGIL